MSEPNYHSRTKKPSPRSTPTAWPSASPAAARTSNPAPRGEPECPAASLVMTRASDSLSVQAVVRSCSVRDQR